MTDRKNRLRFREILMWHSAGIRVALVICIMVQREKERYAFCGALVNEYNTAA